jgi:hypothetical protein
VLCCAEEVASAGPRAAGVLVGQGGGRPGMFQGKAERMERAREALAQLWGLRDGAGA